jgi:hypothetical protein
VDGDLIGPLVGQPSGGRRDPSGLRRLSGSAPLAADADPIGPLVAELDQAAR